ncbi:MAG: UTP--glucose-1-phosphate uridylyltransferase, partial [Phycisphaerales bacterium]|nr:UTP--glucose-1-phosphate uridylyltransferase [Phycisphaerales bacterium]
MSSVSTSIQQQLADHGQEHLLRFWDELNENGRSNLLEQIASIDFDQFAKLVSVAQSPDTNSKTETISPCPFVSNEDPTVDWEAIEKDGEAIIRRGGLGVLTVAGGQGTRLGWNGPKGTFPATPVTGKSLFQLIAEQILFASQKYAVTIPWYIMTSRANDSTTRAFLLDNNCFGLHRADIFVFPQDLVPAVDELGKMLLVDRDQIFLSPDGHGGVINALKKGGALEEMGGRGIEHLAFVQVDNPLVKVVDPVFLGLHCSDQSSGEASSKCVIKTNPDERVGVFCKRGGAVNIVEYTDLSPEQAREKNSNGNLSFGCGSIAVHMFSTGFIERVASELPWHVAHKAVPHIDIKTGKQLSCEKPNAYKFERFVFDVLPLASQSIVFETI